MPRKGIGQRGLTWEIKTRPDIYHPYLAVRHELMAKRIKEAFTSIDILMEEVYRILDKYGVVSNLRTIYRAYAEELWKLAHKYGGKTLQIEAEGISIKYYIYGCDINILREIGGLFGLSVLVITKEMLVEELDKRRMHRIPSFDVALEGQVEIKALNTQYTVVVSELDLIHYLEGFLDLSPMDVDDTVELSLYVKFKKDGDYIVYERDTYSGLQEKPALYVVSKPSKYGIKFTIKQTSGVPKTFDYIFFRRRVAW